MKRKNKQYIEKDNYQDYIFSQCAKYIRLYNLDSNMEANLVCRVLDEVSFLVSKSEYGLIESYNSDDDEAASEYLDELKDDLRDLFSKAGPIRYRLYLPKTHKYIILLRERGFRAEYTSAVREEIRPTGFVFPPMREERININKVFKEYYHIISLLVEDINNMDGWNHIRWYFRNKVLSSDSPMGSNIPITFLSYAFKDNIYALFLYELFKMNNGFLYVDSLFGEDFKNDGKKIKAALSPWIDKASQILFLHSIHSDRTNRGLSSWCSWELGEAYKDRNKKFFKVVVAGIDNSRHHPIVDEDFLELKDVKNGLIIPK